MLKIQFKGLCEEHGPFVLFEGECDPNNADSHMALEHEIDKIGSVLARCPKCNELAKVAMFFNGVQTEPWQDPVEYEDKNGPNAGPMKGMPWEN